MALVTGYVRVDPNYFESAEKGTPVCKFELVRLQKDGDNWSAGEVRKIVPVICFGQTAKVAGSWLLGTIVRASGDMKENSWEGRTREELFISFKGGFANAIGTFQVPADNPPAAEVWTFQFFGWPDPLAERLPDYDSLKGVRHAEDRRRNHR